MSTETDITANDLKLSYLSYLADRNLCQKRIQEYRVTIGAFHAFLSSKNINLLKITKQALIQYQQYMRGYCYFTERVHVKKVRETSAYIAYLYHNNLITQNPALWRTAVIPANKLPSPKKRRYYTTDELIKRWTNALKKANYTYGTIKNKIKRVKILVGYMKENNIQSLYKIKEENLTDYLHNYLPKKFSPDTALTNTACITQLYKFLKSRFYITDSPINSINIAEYKKYLNTVKPQAPSGVKQTALEENPITEENNKLTAKFKSYFTSLGKSPKTLEYYIPHIREYCRYMQSINKPDVKKALRVDIIEYQEHLTGVTDKTGKISKPSLTYHKMTALKSFYRYLLLTGIIENNPASDIELIKPDTGIPHNGIGEKEADRIINAIDVNKPIGIRDRAIIEILYSTGMRNSELTHLTAEDINFAEGLVRINHPKGGKQYQRVVPIGKLACQYAKKYIQETRPFLNAKNADTLFLSVKGNALNGTQTNNLIKKYAYKLGIRKRITSHSWRVTCATLMLKNNADIRYIQEQLGHRSIRTTQGYTRLVPKDLKEIHAKCHPRERQGVV